MLFESKYVQGNYLETILDEDATFNVVHPMAVDNNPVTLDRGQVLELVRGLTNWLNTHEEKK